MLNRLMGSPGARVQAPDDPALYLIDSDGTRRHVPDGQTMVNLFGPTPAIIRRPVSGITAGPDLSSLAYLAKDGDKEYLVTNGEKRWITSPDVFNQFAFDSTRCENGHLRAAVGGGADLDSPGGDADAEPDRGGYNFCDIGPAVFAWPVSHG